MHALQNNDYLFREIAFTAEEDDLYWHSRCTKNITMACMADDISHSAKTA